MEKHKYIFPNFMARRMRKASPMAQQQAILVSLSFMLLSMTVLAIYLLFTRESGIYYKGIVIFNLAAAFLFITSFIIQTYRQYLQDKKMFG